MVAVDADGQVLLVRQPRPAVETHLLELPAGLVDPGEQPIETARRELEEETGFTAQHLEPLLRFYTSPGFCTELLHIFVATDLQEGAAHPDEGEEIELVRMPARAGPRPGAQRRNQRRQNRGGAPGLLAPHAVP